MTTLHIENRIKWLGRQEVDEWDLHGNEYEDICVLSTAHIRDFNEKIEKEIELLKKELDLRKETPNDPTK